MEVDGKGCSSNDSTSGTDDYDDQRFCSGSSGRWVWVDSLAFVPGGRAVAHGKLKTVLPDFERAAFPVHVVHREGRQASQLVRVSGTLGKDRQVTVLVEELHFGPLFDGNERQLPAENEGQLLRPCRTSLIHRKIQSARTDYTSTAPHFLSERYAQRE